MQVSFLVFIFGSLSCVINIKRNYALGSVTNMREKNSNLITKKKYRNHDYEGGL